VRRRSSPAPAALCLAAVLAASCAVPAASPAAPTRAARLDAAAVEAVAAGYRAGYAGQRAGDAAKALEGFLAAYPLNPEDDVLVYLIASSYARAGDQKNAILWLDRLAALRSCFPPLSTSFLPILESDAYKQAEKRLRKAMPRPGRARTAFTVREKDLVPEGIAYDPVEKVFYLSSLYKRKIVRVVAGAPGAAAAVTDFTSEGQDGLDAVLGLKVDAERRHLWAVSSAEPEMIGYREVDEGRSALLQYDLGTGRLLRKVSTPRPALHLLSDLVLDAAGNAYATDTLAGGVYLLAHGGKDLETLVPSGALTAPNGIALSADGRSLYVADVVEGVVRVDIATRRIARLPQPAGLWPGALDGLYLHQNALVGILNLINGGRVARFALNEAGDAIAGAEVLECNNPVFDLPTKGVLVGDDLYFIANSQFGSYDGERRLLVDKLKDIVVLRIPL
jgi:sugar lactone lactonase YvrE